MGAWYSDLKKVSGRGRVSKTKLWKVIREQCYGCVCNSSQEIELCTSPECSLYSYRYGRNPKKDDPIYIKGSTDKYYINDKIMQYLSGKGFREAKQD